MAAAASGGRGKCVLFCACSPPSHPYHQHPVEPFSWETGKSCQSARPLQFYTGSSLGAAVTCYMEQVPTFSG